VSKDTLERLAACSSIATAAIAAAALVIAALQIVNSNDAQREATAQDTYKEYMRLAVENPDIADGLSELPNDPTKRAKYSWFVSYFLHSAEHAFSVAPTDEWRAAISSQVCLHKAFLSSEEYQSSLELHYDKTFRDLVDKALTKCT
jgi:type II secretory pathway pseudopilin PulG